MSMRTRILPESTHNGSFTMFFKPNSLIISSNFLCLLALICCLHQLISARLTSPAVIISGVLCVFYIGLSEIRGRLHGLEMVIGGR